MDINKYTTKAKEVVQNMVTFAQEEEHQAIEPVHALFVLLEQEDGIVPALLSKLAVDTQKTRDDIALAMEKFPKVSGGGESYFSGATKSVFERAESEAKKLKDEYVSTEHIFLGLIEDASVKKILPLDHKQIVKEL